MFSIVFTIGLAVLTGCTSGTRLVDSNKAAFEIRESLVSQTGLDVEFASCPSGIKVKKDVSFTCIARIEGQIVDMKATETDDVPSLHVEPAKAIISIAKAESEIQADLIHRGSAPNTVVACGPEPMILKNPGEAFSCSVSRSTLHYPITVTVLTVGGKIDYAPKP